MRLSNRDWVAWSILTAIAFVAGAYFYAQQQMGTSPAVEVYRIVVTADRPAH